MTVKEVAQYLKMNERTVLKLANEGSIPATKVASQWRFMRRMLDEWLESQMQIHAGPLGDETDEFAGEKFRLAEVVSPETVKPAMTASTKSEAIAEMARFAVETGRIERKGGILLKALVDRERLCSTGLGRGFAFLHPRRALANVVERPLVAVGRSLAGVDFAALDGKPTYIFFLVCAPNDRVHLRLMAALACLTVEPGLLDELLRAGDARDICNVLASAEAVQDEGRA